MRTRRLILNVTVGVIVFSTGLAVATRAGAIVGGGQVDPSVFPYYVRVQIGGVECGGSIIGPDRVLTAAHCVAGASPRQVEVFVNDARSEGALSLSVHPLWDGDVADGHDLAIIALSSGATAGVAPVQVGSPFDTSVYAANTSAWILGHGATSAGGPQTAELRTANVAIRSDDDMADIYDSSFWVSHWDSRLMIGAGNENQTTCNGYSGARLTVFRGLRQIEEGVNSFGETWPSQCAQPSAFARLAGPQLAWVASQVPAVVAGWGSCRLPNGGTGQPYASYVSWFLPVAERDGPYYWTIWCGGRQPTPSPTTSRPSSTPTPTESPDNPLCLKQPWKCP
jgi:hypothetical protein